MRIAASGASGFIGSALVPSLREDGHDVFRLVRTSTVHDTNIIPWDPAGGKIEASALVGIDKLVHLSGENIASGRWNKRRMRRIYDSRVKSSELLARTLITLDKPPQVVVAASAIGYYGSRGDEPLDENSTAGEGFFPDLCRDWEAAWQPLTEKGVRVVSLRIGVVLAAHGGALARMLPIFRLGLGGRMGSGRQYMNWITLPDLIAVIRFALTNTALNGPVNAVAPDAVTNAEFTRTLARVLHRPALFPVPAFALRLAFGKLADEGLLAGARVVPQKLADAGFRFSYPILEPALRAVLEKTA